MKSTYFSQFNIPEGTQALILGSGSAEHVFDLAQKYNVTAVDKDVTALNTINKRNPQIKTSASDIQDFDIEQGKYKIILARNVLPFLNDKDVIFDFIGKMYAGLDKGGVLVFTLFGTKDAWLWREDMAFFTKEEVETFLSIKQYNIYNRQFVLGFGPQMNGEIKFWDKMQFTIRK